MKYQRVQVYTNRQSGDMRVLFDILELDLKNNRILTMYRPNEYQTSKIKIYQLQPTTKVYSETFRKS